MTPRAPPSPAPPPTPGDRPRVTLRRALLALAGLCTAAPQARADVLPPGPQDPRSNDRFGDAVAVVGGQLLVGAPGDNDAAFNGGAVYVFEGSALVDKLYSAEHAAHAWFGGPIVADGDTILVGGLPHGSSESKAPRRIG